jgi:hypothetical protein
MRSREDLAPLARALALEAEAGLSPDEDPPHTFTASLDDSDGIDPAVAELATALSALRDPVRALFENAAERWLDIGISNRHGAAVCRYAITPTTLGTLASARIELVISWYWPHSEIEGL